MYERDSGLEDYFGTLYRGVSKGAKLAYEGAITGADLTKKGAEYAYTGAITGADLAKKAYRKTSYATSYAYKKAQLLDVMRQIYDVENNILMLEKLINECKKNPVLELEQVQKNLSELIKKKGNIEVEIESLKVYSTPKEEKPQQLLPVQESVQQPVQESVQKKKKSKKVKKSTKTKTVDGKRKKSVKEKKTERKRKSLRLKRY